MIRGFRVLSGVVFMLGALAITLAAVIVWMTVLVSAASGLGWGAGALLFAASVWLWSTHSDLVVLPWAWWAAYWKAAHERIEQHIGDT